MWCRNSKLDLKFILFFLPILLMEPSAVFSGGINSSIVKIYTAYNDYNYHEPWQHQGSNVRQGSGCIISGNRILTNAHVVSNATFIKVRRAGQAKKFKARVKMIGHESDLAILTVADQDFFKNVVPLAIGTLPVIKDRVAVFGFPAGGDKLSITEGIISRVEHLHYAHSGAYLLGCQIDASINPGSSGGPVLRNNVVVGVAFQHLSVQKYDNIGYIIPAPIIKHFLEDIADGRYDGTPDLGISMQNMESPDIREKYGMDKTVTGILVNKIYPDSPVAGAIWPKDIILSIEGQPIANDGTIEYRKDERTFFGYIVQKKQIGETISMGILRAGQRKTTDITLTRPIDYERLVPYKRYDIAPVYYIIGGLIFEPLTLNYLMEFGTGEDWYINAPAEMLNLYLNGEPDINHRQIVILVKVLADDINVGYHDNNNVVVTSVNGVAISRISDLVRAFEKNNDDWHVIVDSKGYQIVLNKNNAKKYSDRILKTYHINTDRSPSLMTH